MKIIGKLFSVIILSFFATIVMAQSSEERNLGDFSEVKVGGAFDVVLQRGDKNQVKIEAKGVELDKILTDVSGGVLDIGMKRGSYNYDYVKITLIYKALTVISSSGSSDVTTAGTIKSDDLSIKLSGSGNFKGDVETNSLKLRISGSADMKLSGKANSQDIEISGSGNVKSFDLAANTVKISVSGSGNADVNVSNELDAKVSGSGEVRYKGNPQKQIFKSSGSGSIQKQ
jgi:cytoskeletal protein CcmA (bactofilin family)